MPWLPTWMQWALKRRISSATRWDASSSSNSPTPILIESTKRFSSLRQAAPTINRSIADCRNLRAIHSGSQSGCIRSPSLITSRFGLLNCLRLFHAMVHFPTIDRLIELKKPVLIVVGVKDPLISKERMKSALDVLPNLTMVFHTGAAHAVNYSHPGELASVARNFIEGEPIDIERAGNSIEVIGVASQVEQAV